jgi:O-glycosyl hydrolase
MWLGDRGAREPMTNDAVRIGRYQQMTHKSVRLRRALAAAAATALTTCAGLVPLALSPATTAATAADGLTVAPNPWHASEPFEGWGTSLVWFANATGGYPEQIRDDLYDLVFGPDGMNLNIARYNVGGGNASDVVDYLRPGGAVEGWWQDDPDGSLTGHATTYANRASVRTQWDPTDDTLWDLDSDAAQRWWVQRLADDDRITHWEVFANSAPYFMTEDGYASGGVNNATSEQLPVASMDAFARYLARVADELEAAHGIEVDTIDPFNEPNTNYWSTAVGDDPLRPTGGRQEGMHVGPARQAQMIQALDAVLAEPGTTTDAAISAMDETNPGTFATNWNAYSPQVRDLVGQMNVHSYSQGSSLAVRDLSKAADTRLWMSEVEGSWGGSWNPHSMANGLGLAQHITADLRDLDPSAWVFWQPVEDLFNMEPSGENLNWGTVFVDFDCETYEVGGDQVLASARRVAANGGDPEGVPPCAVSTNSKYNAVRNFTHFIAPGDRLVPVDDTATTAAVSAAGDKLTLVHTNAGAAERRVTVDLSGFATVDAGATARVHATTESPEDDPTANALVPGATVPVDAGARSVTVTLPARSVATIVVDGVHGVSESAAALVDGGTYQVVGVQSGRALAPGTSSAAVIRDLGTTTETVTDQLWTVHEVPADGRVRAAVRRYVLESADGRVLGADLDGLVLDGTGTVAGAADPAYRWMLSTTDGATWSFVNEERARALEVGGQSAADGATVGWYTSNGGANQRWSLRDTTALGSQEVSVHTMAGVEPGLPTTVVPVYAWGAGVPALVSWEMPDDDAWQRVGDVTVTGTATDVYGYPVPATAVVSVGGFTVADPVSMTALVGVGADTLRGRAPTVVPARVAASDRTFDTPVVWHWAGVEEADLDVPGVVTVPGTAQAGDRAVPAVLSVLLTEGVAQNIAPDTAYVTAVASSSESGYGIDATRDGVRTGKAWSNWRSGTKNASDTFTYTWADPEALAELAIYFYADGTDTWAERIDLEYRDAAGAWQTFADGLHVADPGGPVPTALVDLVAYDLPSATGLRLTMHAFSADHYLTVSEVEVGVLRAGPASVAHLAALRLDGESVPDFDPAVVDYDGIVVDGARYPTLAAVPVDAAATVRVTQPAAGSGMARVEVTAADNITSRTYTVAVDRRVALGDVRADGEVKEGRTVTADVDVDPADAAVAWEWLLDGLALDGETGPALIVPTGAGGATLTARVTAAAPGFLPGTAEHEVGPVVPLSADAALAALTADGTPVAGFDPTTPEYQVPVVGSAWPVLAATAADPLADVLIVQPDAGNGGTGRVTVTAEDGGTREYRVQVSRQVRVVEVVVTGQPVVGSSLVAVARTDPADAQVRYQWTLDGVDLPGATGVSHVIDRSGVLAVRVVAEADGFVDSAAAVSAPVQVAAANAGSGEGAPGAAGSDAVGRALSVGPGTGGGALATTGAWAVTLAALAVVVISVGSLALRGRAARSTD